MAEGGYTSRSIFKALIDAPKWPLVIGAILVLIGVIILVAGGGELGLARKLIGALVSELGFAFLIAFVLHASIELHSRLEHDKQISRGIISYIYGTNLDDQIFFLTEEYVFRSPFYRTEMTLDMDFMARQENNVLIKQTISFVIQNISSKTLEYKFKTFVEKPAGDCGAAFSSQDRIGLKRLSIDGVNLNETQLQKVRDALPDNDDFYLSGHTLRMQPDEKRRVVIVNHIEKCLVDSELWRTLVPSSGITLRIRWSESVNLSIKCQAVHPADAFDSVAVDADSITASLLRPLFPHNGVHIWWAPATAPPPAITDQRVGKDVGAGDMPLAPSSDGINPPEINDKSGVERQS